MNKLIIFTNPVAPMQQIVMIKDGVTSQAGIQYENLNEELVELSAKHRIEEIEFRGNREYCLGIMHELCGHSNYNKAITVKYIGG
jgi:hypothetical protein